MIYIAVRRDTRIRVAQRARIHAGRNGTPGDPVNSVTGHARERKCALIPRTVDTLPPPALQPSVERQEQKFARTVSPNCPNCTLDSPWSLLHLPRVTRVQSLDRFTIFSTRTVGSILFYSSFAKLKLNTSDMNACRLRADTSTFKARVVECAGCRGSKKIKRPEERLVARWKLVWKHQRRL